MRWILFSLLCSMPFSASAVTTLNVVGGQLVGATGVVVNGQVWDVEFVEGSCVSLFTGCDEASDFTFHSNVEAEPFAEALLNDILIDGPDGAFGSDPGATFGCDAGADPCWIFVPYHGTGIQVSNTVAEHGTAGNAIFGRIGFYAEEDTSFQADRVYSQWTHVPEPAPAALLAGGLLALGAGRRRRVGSP